MSPLENLHYAIGELAYSIACVDGEIQHEERKKFHDMVEAELRGQDYDFNVSDIIFRILDKDKQLDAEVTYNDALHIMQVNSHYLSPALKATGISFMEKIAKAFPPVTSPEKELLERFKRDIASLHGDPVYYESKQVKKSHI